MVKIEINEKVRPILKNMELWEEQYFPIKKSQTVRTTCSSLHLSDEARFTTYQDKEQKIIVVTRVK